MSAPLNMGGFRGLILLLPAAFAVGAALAEPEQATPPVARGDIRDIRGFLPMEGLPPFVLTGGLLLLAGGLLLARRRARSGARLPVPSIAAPDDPLARLVADYREGRCPGDRLILRLDGLARDALAAGWGIPANRLTSRELRARLPSIAPLDGFMALSDRVKFAGHVPGATEIEEALVLAAGLLAAAHGGRPE